MAESQPMNDRSTVNYVVVLLGIVGVVGMLAILVLAMTSHPVPDEIGLVTTAAVAGLTGLLANTRSTDLGGLQKLAESTAKEKVEAALEAPDEPVVCEPVAEPVPEGGEQLV